MDNKIYYNNDDTHDASSSSVLHMETVTFQPKDTKIWRRKCPIWVVIILFIIAVLFAVLFAIFYQSDADHNNDEKVCTSESCIQTAAMILGKMNKDVDPCQDFSQYACGNFYQNTLLPDEKSYVDTFSEMTQKVTQTLKLILQENTKPHEHEYVKKMKKFYQMCMDIDTIEKAGLTPYLNSSKPKEWPTLNPKWEPLTFNLNNLVEEYESHFMKSLFSYSIEPDLLNTTKTIFTLSEPSLCLSLNRMKKARNNSAILACQQYYTDVTVALGASYTLAREDARAFVDFEIELAKISTPEDEKENRSLLYNPSTLDEMSIKYPMIDWLRTVQSIFQSTGVVVHGNTTVNIKVPAYFASLGTLLKSIDKRVIQNRYGYRYALKVVKDLTQEMRDASLTFLKQKTGVTTESPRWEQCIDEVKKVFGAGLAKQYVTRTFPESSKSFIRNMLNLIKAAFQQQLQNATWMGRETKRTALRKFKALKSRIGYPDKNFSNEDINRKYENVTILDNRFCDTRFDLCQKAAIRDLKRISKDVDNSNWQAESMLVNAYDDHFANEIRIFAGILQPNFFSERFPSSINFGRTGQMLGHEITHFFDNKGRQHDEKGNLRNWWQSEDLLRFNEKIQCFKDQYSAFEIEEISANLDGNFTIGENVADNGGIKTAYSAYLKYSSSHTKELSLPGVGLTIEQQFFLGFGQGHCSVHTNEDLTYLVTSDVHPPGKYRILGTLMNNDEFASAFKCPIGSPMNPIKKCVFW